MNNMVLINPYANSVQKIDDNFWQEIITKLRNKGYSIFVNMHNSIKDNDTNVLSLKELYLLGTKAKCIISLRSGLCDLLMNIEVPQKIIYTALNGIKEKNPKFCHIAYSLKSLPVKHQDKITEYIYNENNREYIISDITRMGEL